ncbi:hypothetical protein CFM90_17095 [Ralstonia solanacearum]|nr:hypothetical protein CFM90_17095 [Ralstonia solanacearum]
MPPRSASWLNQAEYWFATLTEKYIRCGMHRSTRQFEQAIHQYLDAHNASPEPFAWTESAVSCAASPARSCTMTPRRGYRPESNAATSRLSASHRSQRYRDCITST